MLDLTGLKTLSIQGINLVKLTLNGTQIWKKPPSFVNQVPISIDTDGSIFNGVGYKENVRLSSSGGISGSAQNGSVTTGFIPFPDGDKTIIRMKGVEWINAQPTYGGHFYIVFYDANKTSNGYTSLIESPATGFSHIITITRDSNGVETFDLNESYGTTNAILQWIRNNAKFFRVTAYGKGADMIVTVNEEIV
ncbi:MAG: hypothetical protein IKL57_01115 [Oscillospiraceae bacterium]|nr:hypothetical protein [Oscillospiraceae bacterium]